ncbi:MAG: nucleoside triphosphate pyrophosphohydrolase [Paludibacteraceae bacterium]|nr:nucleoside triphosphate pyrophosphohydrolase [Paludibacteraceae bacterium]
MKKSLPLKSKENIDAFAQVAEIIDTLREQCPWDSKQTFDSLRPLSIEEVYELADAIEEKDYKDICKELGDVLMHILFYAKMGDEEGQFTFKDVCERLLEKLIFRHPHIYGNLKAETPEDVERNWEELKQKEKGGNKRVLSGVPKALPSLIKAYRIQDKARNVGFDWQDKNDVWEKVQEELGEVRDAISTGKTNDIEAEFGDLLFSIINAARLHGVDPDNALERTNRKFTSRFNYVEDQTLKQGKELKDMSLEQMDQLWNEAKKKEE